MHYTYVLESLKNGTKYIGSTEDLKKRLVQHNSGVGSIYTKRNYPFKLIYYEAYLNKKDSIKAEKFYKTGYGREILNGKLESYLNK